MQPVGVRVTIREGDELLLVIFTEQVVFVDVPLRAVGRGTLARPPQLG